MADDVAEVAANAAAAGGGVDTSWASSEEHGQDANEDETEVESAAYEVASAAEDRNDKRKQEC